MACVPGTPCFENTVNAYYPKPCDNGWVIDNYPIPTSYSQYDGPNLPNSGVNNKDNLNVVLQKLDNKLSASEIADALFAAIVNDPTVAVAFCTLVNQCVNYSTTTTTTTATTTTTTTTSSSTSTTTSTSTSTTTSTSTSTSTTTTTTTATPTTTTTTTSAIAYPVDFRPRSASSTSQQFKIWFSTDFGGTWTLWTTSPLPIAVYPSWDAYGGLSFNGGQTIYFGLTDLSDNDIQFGTGVGNLDNDFTSLCGRSNPYIINNISSSIITYLNVNVNAGALVTC
ncbi:MAG: hypothetical protein ACOVOV_06820 [Dolichospermum sp.]